MKFTARTELPPLLLIAAMVVLSVWALPGTPAQVPVHWNLSGQPDGWGSRAVGLFTIPSLATFFYLLFRAFPRLDPGRANYAAFAGVYFTIRLGLLTFLALIHGLMIAEFRGRHFDIAGVAIAAAGVLLVLVGSLVGKLRPNWFMGVRTPWTLSSESTWVRTNRLGGRLLMVCGVLFVIAGMLHRPWFTSVAIGAIVATAITVFVYSYLVWRNAPDKAPPGGLPATRI